MYIEFGLIRLIVTAIRDIQSPNDIILYANIKHTCICSSSVRLLVQFSAKTASWPKTLKCEPSIRCAILIIWVGRIYWPKTGQTHYHEQWIPDKSHAIPGLVECNSLDISDYGHVNWYNSTLLSTVTWNINCYLISILVLPLLWC